MLYCVTFLGVPAPGSPLNVTQFILRYVIDTPMFNFLHNSFMSKTPKSLFHLVHTCGRVQDMFHDGRCFYFYSLKQAQACLKLEKSVHPDSDLQIVEFFPILFSHE